MPRIHIPNQNHRTYPGIYGREICEGTVNLHDTSMRKQIQRDNKVGAIIGLRISNGTIRAIFCSTNGHIEYTGNLLANYYNTETKILEMLSLGEVNIIGRLASPPQGVRHNFRHPHPDVTIAYHRDRGAAMRTAKLYASIEDYITNAQIYLPVKYFYLFEDGKWLFASVDVPKFCPILPSCGT